MILLPVRKDEYEREDKGEKFRYCCRNPYSVGAEEQRDYENAEYLEDKRPQKRYEGTHKAVVQGREERRGEYREAAEEERYRVESEGVDCELKKGPVV